jgi:hypothetical protein
MLLNRLVNNDFVHVVEVRIKKDTALLLINDQIDLPIAKTTMVANAPRVKAILNKKFVPEAFKDTPVEEGKSQSYSFKFFLLLLAYIKRTSQLRADGKSPASITQLRITDDMVNAIDIDKLLVAFKDKIKVIGKNLPSYFALENIKVSKSTLYTITKIHPELPPMQWNRTYTSEEIEQWRNFLKNRKYQHYFTKNTEVAF